MVESRPSGGRGGGGTGDDPNGGGWNPFNSNSKWDLGTILSSRDISAKTQAHLTRVYTSLLTSSGTCALGMYLNTSFMITGFLAMIGFMLAFAYCSYQIRNPGNSENVQIAYLLCLAFSMGFMVGPGINHVAEVNPEMLT